MCFRNNHSHNTPLVVLFTLSTITTGSNSTGRRREKLQSSRVLLSHLAAGHFDVYNNKILQYVNNILQAPLFIPITVPLHPFSVLLPL